jgi:hypothetical protein
MSQLNAKRIEAVKAYAESKGIIFGDANYVWGTTFNENGTEKKTGKVHICFYGTKDGKEVFLTLCGIDDVCGNWPFAVEEWFDSEDGCKKCTAQIMRLANV